MPPDAAVRAVASRIEVYLGAHPEAADTVDGICEWWLAGAPEPLVQRALDELVSRGVVRRQDVPGRHPVYSRASRR